MEDRWADGGEHFDSGLLLVIKQAVKASNLGNGVHSVH